MAQQLFRLHKVLQHLERQTWQLQAMWKHMGPNLDVALQAGVAAPARISNQFSTFSGRTFANRANGFAAWETLAVQQQQQIPLQTLRRFTTSPTLKAAAEESGAAAKEAGKDQNVPKAAASSEAASTSGEQMQAATVAMRKGRMSGPVSWGSLALLLITGAGLLAVYDREKRRKLETVKQGPSVGKAAIGGAFELVNQDGKKVTDKDFKGNWNLVYFGFTFCPDICPDELKKMAEAIDKVEKKIGVKVVPIFISVDPERDNVEQVGRYVKEFHPRLVGLTGSVDAVKQAAKAYRVYYMKTEEEGDDYLVDHSIIQYLMDPNMEFVKFFGKNYTVDTLAEAIAGEIKAAAA